jgi:hypothetical protein
MPGWLEVRTTLPIGGFVGYVILWNPCDVRVKQWE